MTLLHHEPDLSKPVVFSATSPAPVAGGRCRGVVQLSFAAGGGTVPGVGIVRAGRRGTPHRRSHRWYKGYWDSEFVFGLLRREWELHSPSGAFGRHSQKLTR